MKKRPRERESGAEKGGKQKNLQECGRNVGEGLTQVLEVVEESEKGREKERFINAGDGYGPLGDCCNVSQ